MSFVLQALQKREAEADPEAAVSLARAGAERRRHRLWMLLFVVAAAVNLALVGWLLRPAPAEPVLADPTSAAPVPDDVAPADPAPVTTPAAVEAAALPAATQPAPEPPVPVRVTLRNLPETVRARLPGLAFSTHVYAEDADLRAVVANGRRLVEGDRLSGVGIHAITETGVVLTFENYLIEVPVFTDWDAL